MSQASEATGAAEGAKRPAGKQPSQVLAEYLNGDAVKRRLADVCTKSIRPEELVRLMLLAASRQPDLLACSQHSILRALMDAAQLGIAPMGIQGRGFLVPRKNKATGDLEATFDPGWRGLCDIARRGGLVKSIDAKVVYEADEFEYYETETGPHLHHVPMFALPDDEGDDGVGRIIAAYARATVEGAVQLEVLRRTDIDRIMKTSASHSGPWSGWFDEMARKSAVRRLCKYLPYSPDLDYAVRVADRADGVLVEERAASAPRTSVDLADAVRSRAPAPRVALGPKSASAADVLFDATARERQPVPVSSSASAELAESLRRRSPPVDPPARKAAAAEPGGPPVASVASPTTGQATAGPPAADWDDDKTETIISTINEGVDSQHAPAARAYMLREIKEAPTEVQDKVLRAWKLLTGETIES